MKLGLPKIAPLNRPGADKDIDRALKRIEQAVNNIEVGILRAGKIKVGENTAFQDGYNPLSKVSIDDVGDLAYEDLVEAAKLGQTIIEGGYIRTELVQVGEESLFEEGYDPMKKISIYEAGGLAYEDLVEEAMLGETIIVGGYIKTDLIDAAAVITDAIVADQAWFGEIAVGAYHEKDESEIESESGASSKADNAESNAKSHADTQANNAESNAKSHADIIVKDLADGKYTDGTSGTFIHGEYIYSPMVISEKISLADNYITFYDDDGNSVGYLEGGLYDKNYLGFSGGFEVNNHFRAKNSARVDGGLTVSGGEVSLWSEVDLDVQSEGRFGSIGAYGASTLDVNAHLDLGSYDLFADNVHAGNCYFIDSGGSARLYNSSSALISVTNDEILYRDADGNWHTVAFV